MKRTPQQLHTGKLLLLFVTTVSPPPRPILKGHPSN